MSPITIGISVLVTLGIAIGAALTAKQGLNTTKGSVAASQLQVVSAALHNYVLNNTAALINGTPITAGTGTVAVNKSPTPDELKAMSLLNANFSTTPTYGGAYLTSITFPNTCNLTTNACPFSELVYYQNPFLSDVSTRALDIHVLGSAVSSSTEKNIGFSATNNSGLISGPGWQVSNPIATPAPGAIGVLGAYRFYSYNATLNNSYNWKSPIDTVLNLPTTNNVSGDVRYVVNINTAFYWNGTTWLSLNNSVNNTVSLGANASNLGTNNTHIGVNAAQSSTASSQSNTVLGYNSGLSANGQGNTTIGASSGSNASNTTNNNNTIVGYSSANTLSSSNLTIVGSNVTVTPGITNAIAIGNGVNLTASNTAVIGSTGITNLVTTAAYAGSSDLRLKSNIRISPYGLNFIRALQPVDYTLKSNQTQQTGFIAQDVEKIAPEFPGIIKPNASDPYYALTYASFIPSLVQSIQELDAKLHRSHSNDPARIRSLQFILAGAMVILLIMMGLSYWSYLIFKKNERLKLVID